MAQLKELLQPLQNILIQHHKYGTGLKEEIGELITIIDKILR